MKTVFCHDTKILATDRLLFSSGGLNKNIISRYLQLSGDFTLLSRKSNLVSPENLSLLGDLDQISFSAVPNFASGGLSICRTAYNTLNDIIDKNDFIIIRLPSMIGLTALCLAKKKKKNHLIEIVGCALDSYRLHSLKGKLIAYPIYWIMRYLVKSSDNVLYVTNSFLQERYPSASTHTIGCSDVELVVDNVILEKRFEKIDSKSKEDVIRIGMMGFLEAKYKGYDTALKALRRLKKKNMEQKYLLEIVGGGDKSYLENLVTQFELDSYVKVIGPLGHPTGVFEWLDNVDIFIQPSKTEGMPRSLIEAMSRGCACIGSNAGEIPELLEFNYVHRKGDFKQLAQSIINLSNLAIMRLNSLEKFNKSFEFDKKNLDPKREEFYRTSMNTQ